MRHLRGGGTVVLEGSWTDVSQVYERLERRRSELVAVFGAGRAGGRQWERARRDVLARVLTRTPDGDGALAPVCEIRQTAEAMARPLRIEALGGGELVIPPGVFAPRSQEVVWLIRRAIEAVQADLLAGPFPDPRAGLALGPGVLDVGCGSGVCAFLAARAFGSAARVTATDILPRAIGATRLNATRLGLEWVGTAEAGDLFEPVGRDRFDLVIFNAPWVVTGGPAPRNSTELATNDPGQRTLTRFLSQAAGHIAPGGRLLLGYSDHSGPRALVRLENLVAAAALEVVRLHRDRIKTRRRKGAWEVVFVYELRAADSDSHTYPVG